MPERVLVTGSSGSGKTTVARAVGDALAVPRTEIDSLYHGRNWVPRETFEADVAALAAGPRWVLEWQYSSVRPLLLARADVMVWLDLTRARVFTQLTRRTVVRRLTRETLWNGNVEPPLWTIFTDPDHLLRWAWRAHPRTASRMQELLAGPDRERVTVVRLGSRTEICRWLDGPLRDVARR